MRPVPFGSPEVWRLLLLATVLIAGAWVLAEAAEHLLPGRPLLAADQWTFTSLRAHRTPAVDQVMITLTECGDAVVVWGVALAAGGWLAWRRAWRPLAYGMAAVGGGSLINTAIKLAVQRARPTDLHFTGASLYSFPSGHSTTNAVLYGFLLILLWRQMPSGRWRITAAACALLVAAICFSRLYLGAHWLSDVIGGLIFASLWLGLLFRSYRAYPLPDIGALGLVLTAAVALAVCAGANIGFNHTGDLHLYALPGTHP